MEPSAMGVAGLGAIVLGPVESDAACESGFWLWGRWTTCGWLLKMRLKLLKDCLRPAMAPRSAMQAKSKGRYLIGAFSRPLLSAALLSLLLTCACGYRVAGSSTPGLPAAIQTIAIPTFQNETSRFKIEQTLTQAVFHEFLTRTSYRLQSQETGSDAVLKGTITAIYSSPIVFDPGSGRTTEVLLTVSLRVVLLDARTQETLYEASNFVFREPFEVSTDAATYIEESQPALERLSREVAASLVSTIIENF